MHKYTEESKRNTGETIGLSMEARLKNMIN